MVLAINLDEKKDLLLDIITSYINTDIRSLADFTDERNLYALVKLLAGRVGSKLDYSKLSRLSGISRPTVTNYISFLEKTYCIVRIPVFTRNPDREIVKAQKIYFCDTGLANVLGEIGGGAQFENTLYNQLAHLGEVKYYALKNGQEIDFVFDKKFALEAKETPTSDDLLTLSRISVTAGIPAQRLIGRHVSPKFEDYIWGGSIY